MRFNVVTPVLNGEKFISETILSVALQSGAFSIRYHVQDGG
jgi:glycosyltransferase involved in cell wall biosynthesis